MTNLALFAAALAALLIVPGPTNAMLLLAGAQKGFRRALPAAASAIAAYLMSVGLLCQIGVAVMDGLGTVATIVKLAVGAYLLLLAWRTWRFQLAQDLSRRQSIGARELFIVTALNPKTLIIAFAIFPPLLSPADLVPYLSLFVALLVLTAGVWTGAGSWLRQLPVANGSPVLFRCLAVGLGAVAIALAVTVVRELVA